MLALYKELLNYDHIIFDWNGTLLSDVELVSGLISDTLEKYKLPSLTFEEFRDTFRFPIKEFYTTIGLNLDHFDEIQHYFHSSYNNQYKNLSLYSGTMEMLEELKVKGKHLSVLSAAHQDHLHEAVDHFGIKPHLNHVYGLPHFGAVGKEVRGEELLTKVSLPKERTIIVGDTLYDAEVAKSLNIDALLVADGHQSYKQLSKADCKILPTRYA